MREAGLAREEAAARLGHADSGQLLDRVYDQGGRQARQRRALDTHVPHGLRANAKDGAAQPDKTLAASPDQPPSTTSATDQETLAQ